MSDNSNSHSYRNEKIANPTAPEVLDPRRLPAAASCKQGVSHVFLLTLLSAVDGTLVLLGASGKLDSLSGAIVVGLTVIAGAGSWIAAKEAFAEGFAKRDAILLAALGAITIIAAVAAVWVGTTIGQAMTLHVLPKAAGLVMVLIGAEIAGLKLPKLGRLPLPIIAVVSAAFLEVLIQWTP